MKKLKNKKNGDAQKKRSGREVRGVSPEAGRESMGGKICERDISALRKADELRPFFVGGHFVEHASVCHALFHAPEYLRMRMGVYRYTGQSCGMVPRWRFLATFLGPAFAASREQHISDLHSKFALGPRHV